MSGNGANQGGRPRVGLTPSKFQAILFSDAESDAESQHPNGGAVIRHRDLDDYSDGYSSGDCLDEALLGVEEWEQAVGLGSELRQAMGVLTGSAGLPDPSSIPSGARYDQPSTSQIGHPTSSFYAPAAVPGVASGSSYVPPLLYPPAAAPGIASGASYVPPPIARNLTLIPTPKKTKRVVGGPGPVSV